MSVTVAVLTGVIAGVAGNVIWLHRSKGHRMAASFLILFVLDFALWMAGVIS